MEPLFSSIALILLIILAQPHLLMRAAAQSNQLEAPFRLTPTRPLTSSSGTFAFGFCNADPSLHPTQLLLAIWFDFGASNCTNRTVVWFARDPTSDRAVIASDQALLTIYGTNNLLTLVDGQWTLWSSSQQQFGSTLVLLDSGNLQLLTSGGQVSWQSFDHPTHTLLPGQTITNSSGSYLLSKDTDMDFSPGRFALVVQGDDNIVMYMRNTDQIKSLSGSRDLTYAYWASGSWNARSTGDTIVFMDNSGNLFYNDSVSSNHNLTMKQPLNSAGSYYHYAALDPDGTVRVYAHQKKNTDGTTWDVVSLFPQDDGCNRKNNNHGSMCGPNAYCKASSSKEQRLSCECPEGYVFVDEKHRYRGCRKQSCNGNHSMEFTTVRMDNTSWSTETSYNQLPIAAVQQCRSTCLSDCSCVAVLIDGISCMAVQILTAGKQGSGTNMTTLIKVAVTSSSILTQENKMQLSRKWLYIIIAILGTFLLASLVRNLYQHYASKKAKERSLLSGFQTFSYKELEQATNGFKELLGKGGFGEVHRGKLSRLHPPHIAVKTLLECKSEKNFENEVRSIGHIHHKNLVRMIGYCKEGAHRMLVFEYMRGGTLADLIFAPERPCWSFLAEAAKGIARGLEYLHEGCQSKIIHCDIKPDNILFDDKHTPRITDFGIAKLLGDQKTHHTITTIAGTRAYLAPEWFHGEGKVDSKVDVYSFGVVLLEMICCKKASVFVEGSFCSSHDTITLSNLRALAESLIRSGRVEQLVQGEREALADMESVERFACVAIWCLQKDPSIRPNMRKVVQMLENTIEVNPLPDPQCFSGIQIPNPTSTTSRLHSLQVE